MEPAQDSKCKVMPPNRKRRRVVAEGSSSASALLDNGASEDATSDKCSVLKEPPPPQPSTQLIEPEGEPPPQPITQLIEPEGEPPMGASKWNFNLGTPGATLTLPPVPADWSILKLLPSEEPATMPEAMFRGLERCIKRHRHDVVG